MAVPLLTSGSVWAWVKHSSVLATFSQSKVIFVLFFCFVLFFRNLEKYENVGLEDEEFALINKLKEK
jgi:hypothetical protein